MHTIHKCVSSTYLPIRLMKIPHFGACLVAFLMNSVVIWILKILLEFFPLILLESRGGVTSCASSLLSELLLELVLLLSLLSFNFSASAISTDSCYFKSCLLCCFYLLFWLFCNQFTFILNNVIGILEMSINHHTKISSGLIGRRWEYREVFFLWSNGDPTSCVSNECW